MQLSFLHIFFGTREYANNSRYIYIHIMRQNHIFVSSSSKGADHKISDIILREKGTDEVSIVHYIILHKLYPTPLFFQYMEEEISEFFELMCINC